MDSAVEEITAELRDELAANDRPRLVDPRTMPVRFHHLKAMARSPLHCFHSFQRDNDKESLAMRLGSGTHALLLGKPIEIWDEPAKTGKGKAPRNGEKWDAFKKLHEGKVIVNAKEMRAAKSIADAIKANELASRLLFSPGTRYEETILWEQNGRARRSTPDARGTYHLVELKTTKNAQPDKFMRDAMWFGYHAQVADYAAAIEATVGIKPRECYLIAVESQAPFAVTVFKLTDRALDMGARLCATWLERLRVCEDSNEWHAYCQSVTDFDVPDDEIDLVFAEDDNEEEQ